MNVSDIKFRVEFDQSAGVIKFADISDYEGNGVDPADVVGIVKITSPSGVEYINSGYDAGVFTNPDVSDDNDLYNDTGLAVTMVDNFEFGIWYFNYKVYLGSGSVLHVSRWFDYQIAPPTPTTTSVFDRDTSVLTFTDTSTYKVAFTHSSYAISTPAPSPNPSPLTTATINTIQTRVIKYPKTISRTILIRPVLVEPPVDAVIDDVSSTGTTVTYGPNCYTGDYRLYLQTYAYYDIQDWGSDTWVKAIFKVYTQTTKTLSSETSEFELYASCITAINEQYESYLSSNPRKAQEYEIIVNKISFYWGLYNIYKNVGRTTSYVTNKLIDLLRKFSGCNVTQPTQSVEIFPIIGSDVTTTTTNGWDSGTEIPAASYGENDDFFLVTTSSRVYKKIAGTWTHIMTISGSGQLRDSVVITTDYSITNSDEFIVVDAKTANITLTLDNIENFDDEKIISIKARTKTYNISIEAASGETIETRSSYSIPSEGDTIDIRPVGTNWEIV